MNEHTNRILSKIFTMLNEFENDKLDLNYLVTSLEGSINVLEEKLRPDFYEKWYLHWGELEQIRASVNEGLITEEAGRKAAKISAKIVTHIVQFELGQMLDK